MKLAVTDYVVIKTTILDDVTEVRLYDETVFHIRNHHPDVAVSIVPSAVETAITNPTHVEASYRNSYVFVDSQTTNQSGDPLRVAVKKIEGTSALVKTAYFASTDEDVVPIWPKSSDV